MGPPPGGSADKASKVKSLLASYYDTEGADEEGSSLHDTPRCIFKSLLGLGASACASAVSSLTVLAAALPASAAACDSHRTHAAAASHPRRRPAPSPAARQLASALAAAASASSADAAALNATYFDPDAYLKRVLKETRLAELAARQRDMLTEVGGLDSDMQARVLCVLG